MSSFSVTVMGGAQPVAVHLDETAGATVTNIGAADVLYATTAAVRTSPDGTLTAGSSATLYGTVWLYAASRTDMQVSPLTVESERVVLGARAGIDTTGVVDATTAINAALVDAATRGVPALGVPGAVYKVSQVDTKTFTGGTDNAYPGRGYGIQLPHGIDVDWGGARLQAATGATFVVLSNQHTAVAGDVVKCRNVIVDGGGEADTARPTIGNPMVWLWGLADGHELVNIVVQHCSYYGGMISKCLDGWHDRLHATHVRGQGWQYGSGPNDSPNRCEVGTLSADNVSDMGTVSQPGNGVAIFAKNMQIERVLVRNCAGGTKYGAWCDNVHTVISESDGTVLAGEVDNATLNSGTKVQGNDQADLISERVTFGAVISRRCGGAGFYVRNAGAVLVDDVITYGNARVAATEDVDVDTFRYLRIGSIYSEKAGRGGVSMSGGSGIYRFGDVTIKDGAEVTTASAVGFSTLGGTGRIQSLAVMDDRTVQVLGKAIAATSAGPGYSLTVQNYRTNIGNRVDVRSKDIVLRNCIFSTGGSPLSDVVTLTAGATSTDVSNANVVSQAVGTGYVEPTVTLIPMNAEARSLLGTLRYVVPANFALRLQHGVATGREVFTYRIDDYTFRVAQYDALGTPPDISRVASPMHGISLPIAAQAPTANRLNLIRVKGPCAGYLRDVSFFVTNSSGNCIVCALDCGAASPATYTALGNSGSTPVAAINTWHTWDPGAAAIHVAEGQELMLGVIFDNTTVTQGRGNAPINTAAALLPAGFLEPGSLAKLGGIRDVGSFSIPASIAEANVLISGATLVMLARIG